MTGEEASLLSGRRRLKLEDGRSLRLLSAMEVLEARREAGELCRDGRERALCANACLLARALERDGRPVFPDGEAALRGMTAGEIAQLAGRWARFDGEENPSPSAGEGRVDAIKKGWSARARSAFAGVCSGFFRRCPPKSGPGR